MLGASLHSRGCIILGEHVGGRLVVVLNRLAIVVEAFLICNVVLAFLGVVLRPGHDGGLVTVLGDVVHGAGADLQLDALALRPDHRGV